jgi:hypothetical protein
VIALLLITALVVAAIEFVVQRTRPAHTNTYQVYTLVVTPASPWHPGQSLSLQWAPRTVGIDGSKPPRSVTCTFSLYDSYPTQAAAQAALGKPALEGCPLVASAPPLTLAAAVGAPAPSPVAYALPDALVLGYYVVVSFVEPGSPGTSATSVVEVTA